MKMYHEVLDENELYEFVEDYKNKRNVKEMIEDEVRELEDKAYQTLFEGQVARGEFEELENGTYKNSSFESQVARGFLIKQKSGGYKRKDSVAWLKENKDKALVEEAREEEAREIDINSLFDELGQQEA